MERRTEGIAVYPREGGAGRPPMTAEQERLYHEALRNYVQPGHPTAFAGLEKVYRHYNKTLPRKLVKHMLTEVYAYGLHRKYKKPSQRTPYLVLWPREQVHSDLAAMTMYKGRWLPDVNDGVHFFMLTIDIFTKRVWLRPQRSKSAEDTLIALRDTFQAVEATGPRTQVGSIVFDSGLEYRNQQVTRFLQNKGVRIMKVDTTQVKAAFAERAIGSIKAIIYAYMTQYETYRWVDRLPQFEATYNNRLHRSIQCTPMEAEDPANLQRVKLQLMKNYSRMLLRENVSRKSVLPVGTLVRIQRHKRDTFARGFHTAAFIELFEVVEVVSRHAVTMYKVRQVGTDRVLPRTLYRSELTPVSMEEYRISEILDHRVIQGRLYYLVRWTWFNDDSWVAAEHVTRWQPQA
jgi:hypothetical protein